MKRFIMIICLMLAAQTAMGAEKALMLSVFGTSTEASVTFEKLLPVIKKEFSDRDIFVPYTSSVIRNKLNAEIKNSDDKILSPAEMLEKLKNSGYKDIAVVSTLLFPGVEHDRLEKAVNEFSKANASIKVSYTKPVLSHDENIQTAVKAIQKYMITEGINVVVTHGTHDGHPVEKNYLKVASEVEKSYKNSYVGSIEGVPSMEETLEKVEKNQLKNVRFIVFMFVAGDHAENDIAGDEDDSLFEEVKSMGKTPSVAWTKVDGKDRMVSLGLDEQYLSMLIEYYKKNVK